MAFISPSCFHRLLLKWLHFIKGHPHIQKQTNKTLQYKSIEALLQILVQIICTHRHKFTRDKAWDQFSKKSSSFPSSWVDLRSKPIPACILQGKGNPWIVCNQTVPGRLKLCSLPTAGKCNMKNKCIKLTLPNVILFWFYTKPTCLCSVLAFRQFESDSIIFRQVKSQGKPWGNFED